MSELSFYDKQPRPWPNPLLTSASIVGHTTDTTCRLWIRVYHPAKYWLVVSKEPFTVGDRDKPPKLSKDQKSLDGQALVWAERHEFAYATDITHVFDLTGLEPETTYYYGIFAEADAIPKPWELGYRERLSFRTRAAAPRRIVFGFHSCHMPYEERNIVSMNLWDEYFHELTQRRADFVIGGGDQVYVDGNDHINIWKWLRKVKDREPKFEHMLSWYRDIYRGYWGHLSVRRILHSFPNYMIWDDHEIMDGWGSYTEDELSNELDRWWGKDDKVQNLELAREMFEAAKRVYHEYQHGHNPATPAGQYDYAFEWGPAAFYVLDMRGHRDYNRKTGTRILGADQMNRFKAWLDKEKDKDNGHGVLFVITPVPVVHASSFFVNKLDLAVFGIHDDLRDEWEHASNWAERDVLLDAVFEASEKSGKKVVFLSGDVHLGASFHLSDIRHPGAKVHQLTSSGITYAGAGRTKRLALKLAVADSGTLQETAGTKGRFAFKRLSVFQRHNFAIMTVEDDNAGRLLVHYDLYGAPSSEEEAIVRLKRITF